MNRDRVLKDRGWKNVDDLPKGPNGNPLCRWCKKETEPPKKTFCSTECVQEWRVRSDPGYAREKVFERDRGVCAKCGLDTEKLKSLLYSVRMKSELSYMNLVRTYRAQHGFGFNLSEHFYEVDHIIPVHLGGGSCGLENLATLCRVCHRNKTRGEMRRKRQRRKGITSQWRK